MHTVSPTSCFVFQRRELPNRNAPPWIEVFRAMCVLWRYRLAAPLLAVLLFIVCEAQIGNEAQISKLYPRGNHWAVGHLMGKKSIDELVDERDSGGGDEQNLTGEKQRETLTEPSALLRALVNAVAGAEEQRRLRKEQEELKQAAKTLLILTLNTRDSSGS